MKDDFSFKEQQDFPSFHQSLFLVAILFLTEYNGIEFNGMSSQLYVNDTFGLFRQACEC